MEADISRGSTRHKTASTHLTSGPFARLPDEIIEQILLATDPNGFASLVVLNSKWRAVSQRSHLYLHHLAHCPSYLSSHAGRIPPDHEQLSRLRRLFAREVKRSLFDSYLRPRKTIVKLVSNSISSSSCPGGEGMRFGASLSGHHLLAYNSSRIYVIDVRGDDLQVKRQLKILRRPVSACVTDDATLLAVLSTEVQVDLYDLQSSPPKRKRSLILDNCPRTIALSSCGSVLAAAYEGGIQVSSLDPGALPTDRRAVKCDAVDALAFSPDGTQILGTTTDSSSPSTVVLTAPYYDPGSQPADSNLAAMWTTSILFPNTSRDCSHAILLPRDGDHGELEWTFTYDRSFETFRAVRLDDLRNGTTYFTGPLPKPNSPSKLLPCTLPASAPHGELVAAGFRGNEVWIYGVPGDLEAIPETAATHDSPPDPSAIGRHGGLQAGLSRHASSRNNFVTGCKIAELAGVSNVKWVTGFAGSTSRERLLVTARGVSGPRLATEEEDIDFVDGGRIALVDFDYSLVDGEESEVVIEVGADEAEVLEEETRDIAAEVAIVRRRTVAQRQGAGDIGDDPLVPRIMGKNPAIRRLQTSAGSADSSDEVSMDELEALDIPYEHASPRSGTTLRRAATAAAANRRLNPRTADGRPIEYRRADGRAEHPHESDADNWVPPPPPYQKEDPGDLPAFLRGPSVPPPTGPFMPPLPPFPLHDGRLPASFSPAGQGAEAESSRGQRRRSHPRLASASTTSSGYRNEDPPRPTSSPSIHSEHMDFDDIYDVSPPDSPRLSAYICESHQPPGSAGAPSESLASSSADAPPAFARPAASSTWPTTGSNSDQGRVPISLVNVHHVSLSHSMPASATEPSPRRPSNAQTWPLPTTPEDVVAVSAQAVTGHTPSTAPSSGLASNDLAILPPPPSLEQLASLNRRSSLGNPRRLSGGVRSQSDFACVESSARGPWQDDGEHRGWRGNQDVQIPEFDRPLIISTPKGIAGALDPPASRTRERRDEPQILAPVPRHPRPTHLNHSNLVLESLEQPSTQGARAHRRGISPQRRQRRLSGLPVWLRAGPAASRSPTTPVHRRPSRAERSAAQNMIDARKRGWKGKHKGGKKKGGGGRDEASSSAGWTDVSTPSASKEKKCAVM
ncbi:F-box domain-containing protein [Hirsutella rhossiliensis]|uniref:F-box domain-containing protein n=1 Tax=Hirsutella rhossiliensis TaxID=111463 RepID=A0A9P8N1Y9_9HYPO|nr:F-box domain-containing protein [Hirsutella rhossiliensis]KAH0963237.1 F-box domain-containing protein [Hirsutella rhossiliensis]